MKNTDNSSRRSLLVLRVNSFSLQKNHFQKQTAPRMLKSIFVLIFFGLNLVEGACPTGTSSIPTVLGSRWPCASINASPTTFFDAELSCQKQDGHLISIPNVNVNTMLSGKTIFYYRFMIPFQLFLALRIQVTNSGSGFQTWLETNG